MIYPGSVSGDPLNHSVQESMIHPRRVRPHKRQQLIDHSCSLLSLHQSLIVGWGGGDMYFQCKTSRAITPHADNQSIPLQCFLSSVGGDAR